MKCTLCTILSGLGLGLAYHAGTRTHAPSSDTPPAVSRPLAHRSTPPQVESPAVTPAETHPAPETPALAIQAASPNPVPARSELETLVDSLLAVGASFADRQARWKDLRQAGRVDQALAELEHRLAADPEMPGLAVEVGMAYVQKLGMTTDLSDLGILAMKADKVFATALKVYPASWEARFYKSRLLANWPPELNKGAEVIEGFESLVQQQEAVSPEPHFAQTYTWLGDQYQKAGRADDARTMWQRGASLFPSDPALVKRVSQ